MSASSSSGNGIYASTWGNGSAVQAVTGNGGTAVTAQTTANSGSNWGIGLYASVANNGANNVGYAVQAVNNSASGWGIYASGTSPNYFAGNVGIGTTSPISALQVVGDINSSNEYTGNIYANAIRAQSGTAANPTYGFVYGGGGTGLFQPGGAGSNVIGFSTNGQERARVDASGNVGIGTSSPSTKLEVASGTAFMRVSTAWIANAGTWIDLDTSGPSGIGTGGPGNNAWVSYTSSLGQWFSNSAVGDVNYRNALGKKINIGIDNGAGTAAPEMVVTGTGVGFGTNAPGSAVDVKGTMRLSGATSGYNGFVASAVAGSTVWTLPVNDGTSGQVLSTNGSGQLQWTTAGGGGGNHITSSGSTPTGNYGAAMGGSSPAPGFSISGHDSAHQVIVFTGSAPTGPGVAWTVTFATPFSSAPICVMSPAGPTTAASYRPLYVQSSTTTGYTVGIAGTPLTYDTLQYNVICSQ